MSNALVRTATLIVLAVVVLVLTLAVFWHRGPAARLYHVTYCACPVAQ